VSVHARLPPFGPLLLSLHKKVYVAGYDPPCGIRILHLGLDQSLDLREVKPELANCGASLANDGADNECEKTDESGSGWLHSAYPYLRLLTAAAAAAAAASGVVA